MTAILGKLGVESVEEVREPLALLTDEIGLWNLQLIEENLIRLMPNHVPNWPNR